MDKKFFIDIFENEKGEIVYRASEVPFKAQYIVNKDSKLNFFNVKIFDTSILDEEIKRIDEISKFDEDVIKKLCLELIHNRYGEILIKLTDILELLLELEGCLVSSSEYMKRFQIVEKIKNILVPLRFETITSTNDLILYKKDGRKIS